MMKIIIIINDDHHIHIHLQAPFSKIPYSIFFDDSVFLIYFYYQLQLVLNLQKIKFVVLNRSLYFIC